MNTSQLKPSGLGRISDPTKNASNRKENPLGKSQTPENSTANLKQARKANKAEIMSSLKDPKKNELLNKAFGESSPKINEYLKMISRFENKVKQDQVEEKDLERIMKALEEKILSMNSNQKNRLKGLEFFKKHGIENMKNMKQTLIEMFENNA